MVVESVAARPEHPPEHLVDPAQIRGEGNELQSVLADGPVVHPDGVSAYASTGGHAQTRLRSPNAWSIRPTGGQYLSAIPPPPGCAPTRRGYGRDQSSAVTSSAGCGALRSGLSPTDHSSRSMAAISPRIATMAAQKRS